ncbi:MAG: hypothetical protein AAB536_03195, partial [Patescibacteria group bacterium]
RALEAKENELKAQLKAAHRAGDTAKAEVLAQELGQVKAQLELLELKEEEFEDDLDEEEEKLENEMDARAQAEEAIRDAEKQKQDALDEAQEEGITLPANTFAGFDSLLTQAKSAFQAGNYEEAERLAEQTGDVLELIENDIDEEEQKLDDKEDAEEAIEEQKEEEGERKQKEAEKQQDEAEEQSNEAEGR